MLPPLFTGSDFLPMGLGSAVPRQRIEDNTLHLPTERGILVR